MKEELPYFRYHPNPVKTGAIEERDTPCVCCDKEKGYVYVASVYARGEYREKICPWCIADGSAAEKLQAHFVNDLSGPVPPEVRLEINERTPGFTSWQQEEWQVHCGDACEFHGDVSKSEMKEMKPAAAEFLRSELQMNESEWTDFVKYYGPGGDPAVYKFVCRHCGKEVYSWDCS